MTASHDLPAGCRLVPLAEEQTGAVLRIFNRHVTDGFAAYPEEPVSEAFIARLLRSAADHPAVAAVDVKGDVIGFLRPYSPVSTLSHTAVTTMFLAPEWTRRGISGRRSFSECWLTQRRWGSRVSLPTSRR